MSYLGAEIRPPHRINLALRPFSSKSACFYGDENSRIFFLSLLICFKLQKLSIFRYQPQNSEHGKVVNPIFTLSNLGISGHTS